MQAAAYSMSVLASFHLVRYPRATAARGIVADGARPASARRDTPACGSGGCSGRAAGGR